MERKKILAKVKEKGILADGITYKVVREIGDGGNGLVLLCEAPQSGSIVAKLYVPPDGRDLDEREYLRFEREIMILLTLKHPNIVRALAAGTIDIASYRVPFYLMPQAKGTLKDLIKQTTATNTLEVKLRAITRVLLGVSCLHSHGVFHRDLKPANILMDQLGNPWVADLGIAHSDRNYGEVTLHTVASDKLRNQDYYAPEQRFGTAEVDHRADIYALGCILYELIAGLPPIRHPAPPLASFDEAFEPLDRVVNRMMAFQPNDRYPNLEDAIEDLAIAAGWVLATYRGARPPESLDLQTMTKLLRSSNEAHRQRGVEVAARLGRDALTTLYELLGHARRELRNAAASALGAIADLESLPFLVAALYGTTSKPSLFRPSADTAARAIGRYPLDHRISACNLIQKPVRTPQILEILSGVPKAEAYEAAESLLGRQLVLFDYDESKFGLLLSIDEERAWPTLIEQLDKVSDFKIKELLRTLSAERRVQLLNAWISRGPRDGWYLKYMLDEILAQDVNIPGMTEVLGSLLALVDRYLRYAEREQVISRIQDKLNSLPEKGTKAT